MKPLFQSIALCAVIVTTSFSLGCQQTRSESADDGRYVAHPTIDRSQHPNATLIVGSTALLEKIKLIDPRLRQAGAFMQGQVTLQNLSDDRLALEYRITWEDDQGFQLDQEAMWTRIFLGPRQTRRIQSTGKQQQAGHMVVTVRAPDDYFIDYDRRNPPKKEEDSNQ
ncbi:DUF1425 domain-containing protein [Endothiovibrio diazotrophicus]